VGFGNRKQRHPRKKGTPSLRLWIDGRKEGRCTVGLSEEGKWRQEKRWKVFEDDWCPKGDKRYLGRVGWHGKKSTKVGRGVGMPMLLLPL